MMVEFRGKIRIRVLVFYPASPGIYMTSAYNSRLVLWGQKYCGKIPKEK
jgi:hypothetical protein